MDSNRITRRGVFTGVAGAALGSLAGGGFAQGRSAPASPVAIARCRSYDANIQKNLATMLDQIGGIGSLVKGKTVAIKLNLTGQPARFPVDPKLPYRTESTTLLATCNLIARAGAKRIRIIENFFPAGLDMALWGRYQLDLNAINNVGCKVEWENCQNLGQSKKYVTMKVPGGGLMFPAFHLNHSYADCDVYVSLSKLKHHYVAGVTMALKNNFGITPCSLYGGDCGPNGNEDPKQERGPVCHNGKATPPKGVPQELHPDSPREAGYRIPRIVTDLVCSRPIDLAIVDGVDSIRGGEGSWIPGTEMIKPGVLLAGKNPVCVDAVSTAVMGYDPRAQRGTKPFLRGDNTMLLAEAAGVGTADLSRIEVAGLSVREALCDFGPGAIGKRL